MNQDSINVIPLSWIVYGGIIHDIKNHKTNNDNINDSQNENESQNDSNSVITTTTSDHVSNVGAERNINHNEKPLGIVITGVLNDPHDPKQIANDNDAYSNNLDNEDTLSSNHNTALDQETPVSTEVAVYSNTFDRKISKIAVPIAIEEETTLTVTEKQTKPNDEHEIKTNQSSSPTLSVDEAVGGSTPKSNTKSKSKSKSHARGTASQGSRELSYQFDSNHLKQRANSIAKISKRQKWGYAYNVKGLKMKLKPNFNVFEPSNNSEKLYLCKIIAYNLFTKYCQHRSLYEINICWDDRQYLFSKMHSLSTWMNTADRNINVENEIDNLYYLFDSCIDEMYSLMRNSARSFLNSEVSTACYVHHVGTLTRILHITFLLILFAICNQCNIGVSKVASI